MKKKSIGMIILRNFLKTLGVMLLFVVVGVLSYYLTMLYYNKTGRTERSTQYTHAITVNTGNESSNLIYSYDEKTKKIKAVVLELFDENTKNLSYVTIPANTQITISTDTYSDLIKVSQKLPQVAKLSDINEYFTGDVAYEYGILILQDTMDVDIGYFTAMPTEEFDKYFEKKSNKEPLYKPAASVLAKLKDKGDVEDLMDSCWDNLISDTTLSQKQKYASSLAQVNQEYIRVHGAFGTKTSGVFELNGKKTRKMVNNIWEADAYTASQTVIKGDLCKTSSSSSAALGKKIWIANGSAINGLASSYQNKMTADGYTVTGVGNYTGIKQTSTTIYAKKTEWGKPLLNYYKNAAIKSKSELSQNPDWQSADIVVVLGTDAALE